MAINTPTVSLALPLPKALPTDLPSTIDFIKSLVEILQQQNWLMAKTLTAIVGSGALNQRPTVPPNGATYWDGTHFYVFDGTNWQTLV